MKKIVLILVVIAFLINGASAGQSLEIGDSAPDFSIVDASGKTDLEGKPTENHDPCLDIEMLDKELDKWYYNILMKVWKTFARQTEMQKAKFSEAVTKQFSGLKVKEEHVKKILLKLDLNSEKPSSWKDEEVMNFASELRKISKV